ncbi:hypothetical protein Tsubulata_011892 [Turnera subulata]|uniref:Uncharacterized protein n=1 Tax=Turnera subulata TaxID=218843 RepID=A0A9Q0JM65_9ROSI|nr:hypothetical protein Tsubulata_011892 [Turnera subulata]
MQPTHQARDFVLADIKKRFEPSGGEYLYAAQAAEVAPMVAVVGGCHGGEVVVEVLAVEEGRAVGEDDIVLGEAFLRGGWGGNDHHEAGTKAKRHDWAVCLGEFL